MCLKFSVQLVTLFVDKDCCGEPDILLTADCTINKFVWLKWITRLTSSFHFCVIYQCNADDSVDYCSAKEVRVMLKQYSYE